MNPMSTKISTVKKSALILGSTAKPSLVATRKSSQTKKYSSPITTAATVASSAVFNTNRNSMSISTSQAKEINQAAYKTAFVQKRSSLKKSMNSTTASNHQKKSLNTTTGTVPFKETDEVLRSRNPS